MRSRLWIGAIFAAVFAALILGLGVEIGASSNYGAGWWGPGMMGGYSYRMGLWMTAPPWRDGQTALSLTAQDVRDYFQPWLAWQGNPRLKLGDVTEKDADTITADIVTRDKDVLVLRFVVNRHTGFSYPSED